MPIRDVPGSDDYEKPARAEFLYDGPPLEEREASVDEREFKLDLPTLRAVMDGVIRPAIDETQVETILRDQLDPNELADLADALDNSISHIARQGGQRDLANSIKEKMARLIAEAEQEE